MTTLTTLALPTRSDEDANLRPMPWKRMAWVTWRQHRTALTGVAVLLVALAACFWVAGLRLHHAYAAAIACHPAELGTEPGTATACAAAASLGGATLFTRRHAEGPRLAVASAPQTFAPVRAHPRVQCRRHRSVSDPAQGVR
jgi:hypothetical protein